MRFTDTHFIIAYRLLCEPDRQWKTGDFADCHRPSVVSFFNYLIGQGVLERKSPRGRNSISKLVNPQQLLGMCVENFRNNEEKAIGFVSKRPDTELVNDLIGRGIEFYPGRFSGIRGELIQATVTGLSLLIPDRRIFYGERLAEFQMDFKLLKVGFGGNITVILPRYKLFLRKYAAGRNGVMLPSDFYTYLFLSVTDTVIAEPQKAYFEKQLGGVDGNFLAWR